jgi:hypothetical protein
MLTRTLPGPEKRGDLQAATLGRFAIILTSKCLALCGITLIFL